MEGSRHSETWLDTVGTVTRQLLVKTLWVGKDLARVTLICKTLSSVDSVELVNKSNIHSKTPSRVTHTSYHSECCVWIFMVLYAKIIYESSKNVGFYAYQRYCETLQDSLHALWMYSHYLVFQLKNIYRSKLP